jgi:hypothetical protein
MSDSVHLSAELSLPVALESILAVSLDNLKVILEYFLSVLKQHMTALNTGLQSNSLISPQTSQGHSSATGGYYCEV